MCEKFPFKEIKSDLCRSMLETGLEGVKGVGGGGGVEELGEIYLNLPAFPSD